ncbi:hypothetical protein M413DRAFT_194482 [Hebeloma cylindrosporum]|uniref:Uncharacterized protein n=1 Tax=Hebeloma cylindrosporum TaxID=76867 RepID=A0A0C3C7X0_HEBCY|nr:hypothetical protein M413DRAFT_194482 [Hebeloma cylindrosporum h7]
MENPPSQPDSPSPRLLNSTCVCPSYKLLSRGSNLSFISPQILITEKSFHLPGFG